MFEKVNPSHPDKVADRIAGAIVDLAYAGSAGGFVAGMPKVAVEVLLGHGLCTCIIETSLGRKELPQAEIEHAVRRIGGDSLDVRLLITEQDRHLAENQQGAVRCGDNGIFKGCAMTSEQKLLTAIVKSLYESKPHDGKFIIDGAWLTLCQSNMADCEIEDFRSRTLIPMLNGHRKDNWGERWNPLGYWTGGTGVDCGATNRKLGSDMGDAVTGGGLHGKDLSKADVSVNIVCHMKAQTAGCNVEACCAIGDEAVTLRYGDGRTETMPFADIVEQARLYILTQCDGSFEHLAEWGLIR